MGSTGAPPQCEGCYSQEHDQEDPSKDGGAVVAPLGAGLLFQVNLCPVWEGEGREVRTGVRGQGDGNQNCLVGGEKKGEKSAFQETEVRPQGAVECQPWQISQCLVSQQEQRFVNRKSELAFGIRSG